MLVATPQLSENDKENIRFELHPASNFRIVVSRNNYQAYISPTTVESAMVAGRRRGGRVAGFQLDGSCFDSSSSFGKSSAMSLGVQRMLTQHFEAGVDFLRSGFEKNAPNTH